MATRRASWLCFEDTAPIYIVPSTRALLVTPEGEVDVGDLDAWLKHDDREPIAPDSYGAVDPEVVI